MSFFEEFVQIRLDKFMQWDLQCVSGVVFFLGFLGTYLLGKEVGR